MINLNIQIKLIIFSFIFGFLFSMLLDIFYYSIKKKNRIYSILVSLSLIIIMTIVYFIGINKIGYIIFHLYSILAIVIGFIIYEALLVMIAKNNKK